MPDGGGSSPTGSQQFGWDRYRAEFVPAVFRPLTRFGLATIEDFSAATLGPLERGILGRPMSPARVRATHAAGRRLSALLDLPPAREAFLRAFPAQIRDIYHEAVEIQAAAGTVPAHPPHTGRGLPKVG